MDAISAISWADPVISCMVAACSSVATLDSSAPVDISSAIDAIFSIAADNLSIELAIVVYKLV